MSMDPQHCSGIGREVGFPDFRLYDFFIDAAALSLKQKDPRIHASD